MLAELAATQAGRELIRWYSRQKDRAGRVMKIFEHRIYIITGAKVDYRSHSAPS